MNPDRDHVDPAIDALLRTHSAEMPSAEIDATILAAAHRAVRSTPLEAEQRAEATRPWRWWMPLAAAATIGAITIGVLQLAPKEPDTTSAIVGDAPPAVAVPAQPAAPAAVPAEKEKADAPTAATEAPRAKVRNDRAAQAAAARAEVERAPAPDPFPAAADKAATRESAGNAAGAVQRSAAAPAAPAAMAKSALADSHERSAAEWVERIRALVTEGKLDQAAQELTSFRAAYVDADTRLPAELQAWAATVKR